MSEFLHHVEQSIQERHLLKRGQKVLAAVSGGLDSMALLYTLHALAKKHRWQVFAAHFNHRLRGRASAADAALVRRTAARLGLRFVGGAADVKAFAVQSKLSIEMAARKLRHAFLARAAAERDIPTIALAHHAGDQVEHFFLRLLRGAGGEGLAGMKWRSASPADGRLALIRPLLDVAKADLLSQARALDIPFREDATNASTDFLRNRIRHELLSLLRKRYQPGIDRIVLRLMDIVGAESEYVRAQAKAFLARRGGAFGPKLFGAKLNGKYAELPLAIQRRVIQEQLVEFGVQPDFELIEQLRQKPETAVNVCAGLWVARDASGKVHRREQTSSKFNPAQLELKLTPRQGGAEFGGRTFRWHVKLMDQFQSSPRKTWGGPEYFDAARIGRDIVLRHWRPGDRFQPIGLKSPSKLQDLFVNSKIPAAHRRELALATTKAGEIFWVEGLRIGEQFKLTSATRRKMMWTVCKTL